MLISIIIKLNFEGNTSTLGDIITKIFKESKIKFNVKEPNNNFTDMLKFETYFYIIIVISCNFT